MKLVKFNSIVSTKKLGTCKAGQVVEIADENFDANLKSFIEYGLAEIVEQEVEQPKKELKRLTPAELVEKNASDLKVIVESGEYTQEELQHALALEEKGKSRSSVIEFLKGLVKK